MTRPKRYSLAEQVQPQNGNIIARTRYIDLTPAGWWVYKTYPDANRQARDGFLFVDAGGFLYINPSTENDLATHKEAPGEPGEG